MHSGIVQNGEDAMLYYGTRRTKDGKGVTIASQKRYVKYYEAVLKKYNGKAPPPRKLRLTKLRVHTVPNFSGKPFVLIEKGNERYSSPAVEVSKKDEVFEIHTDHIVEGDVKVQLCARKSKRRHQKMCHFWFSTAFVKKSNHMVLEKSEIDVANKDKKNVHFKENFKIEAFFENIDEPKLISSKKVSKRKSNKKLKRVKSKKVSSSDKMSSKQKDEDSDNVKREEESIYVKRKRAQSFYESDDELSSGSDKDEKMMNMYFKEEEDEDDKEEEEEEVVQEEEEKEKEVMSTKKESKKTRSEGKEKKSKSNGVTRKKSEKSMSKKKLK